MRYIALKVTNRPPVPVRFCYQSGDLAIDILKTGQLFHERRPGTEFPCFNGRLGPMIENETLARVLRYADERTRIMPRPDQQSVAIASGCQPADSPQERRPDPKVEAGFRLNDMSKPHDNR